MPIRRSPLLTPRSLAARRANALKSTGPRTPAGKARVSFNALKHGHSMGPAGRAPRFRQRLLRAGYPHQEALYGGLRSCLAQVFGARSPKSRREVDRFAAGAWCVAMGRSSFRTKLESTLDSMPKGSRVLSQDHRKGPLCSLRYPAGHARSLRYRAEDPWRRIGLVFWIQRRRYLTPARVKRMLAGLDPVSIPASDEGLETRMRCVVFRLRRPGYFERLSYGLDRNGDPDWSRQPWRSLPGYREQWEAARRRNTASPDGVSLCEPASAGSSRRFPPRGAGVHAGSPSAADTAKSSSRELGLVDRVRGRIREAASRVVAGVSRWVGEFGSSGCAKCGSAVLGCDERPGACGDR
jgi:hypothetical protein